VHTVLSQRIASSACCAESLKRYRKVRVLSKQGMLYGKWSVQNPSSPV
jgi:hypothetical protein